VELSPFENEQSGCRKDALLHSKQFMLPHEQVGAILLRRILDAQTSASSLGRRPFVSNDRQNAAAAYIDSRENAIKKGP